MRFRLAQKILARHYHNWPYRRTTYDRAVAKMPFVAQIDAATNLVRAVTNLRRIIGKRLGAIQNPLRRTGQRTNRRRHRVVRA
jgi:hypothetical protein